MKKLICTIILGFSALTHADNGPGTCPDVSQIKSMPLTHYLYFEPAKAYSAFTEATYDSAYQWGFAIAPIKEKDGERALKTANDLLPLVSGNPTPRYSSRANAWLCKYTLTGKHKAMAATQMDPAIIPLFMK